MPSLKNILLAAAILVVSAVNADYIIDPTTVPIGLRTTWCASELSSCPLICQQSVSGPTRVNTCDPASLTYGCVCANGLQPNISEFTLTLPYFTCTEWGTQCVKGCGQNNDCSRDCREKHPCGALNPSKPNVTSTTTGTQSVTGTPTAASSATSSNVIFTGLGGAQATASSTPGKNAAPALAVGSVLGFLPVIAGLVTGFAFIL